jgi:hypothetical protein
MEANWREDLLGTRAILDVAAKAIFKRNGRISIVGHPAN